MTLRLYLALMTFTTTVCWLAFIFIIRSIDPEVTNWLGFTLFYLALFLALIGSAAIIGFIVRFVFLKRELLTRSVSNAFRQSFFFSFVIIVSLFLLNKDLLTWFNLSLLIIGLSVLEYFLVSCSSHNLDHEVNSEESKIEEGEDIINN